MFASQVLYALQLDHEHVLHENIGEVFSNIQALVGYGEASLGGGGNSAQSQFSQQGSLVHFFQKARPQRVRDLKCRRQHPLGQPVHGTLIIDIHSVHYYRRSSAFIGGHFFFAPGNVGIGTTAPAQKLEVNGNMQVDGGIYFPGSSTPQTVPYTGITCGGDYAESVDVTGDRKHYEPGDVLVIDPNTPGKFLKSAAPYSTSVSGIYSTKPGTLGRRQTTAQSPDEVPMAVVGIVPAKVSAENGAVHPGDLLVSSSKIGYAMKGTDRSLLTGAVIGKAMGNLDSGTGVIEVLVTLQ